MSVKFGPVSQTALLLEPSQVPASYSQLKQVIAKIESARNEWESYVDELATNPCLSFTQPILANLAAYKLELDSLPNDAVVVREYGYAIIKTLSQEVEYRGTESSPLLYDSYGTPEYAVYKADHKMVKQFPGMKLATREAMERKPK